MSSTGGKELKVFSDADWGASINRRRSITGYLVQYEGFPISWKSKKQLTVYRSSTEAEYRTMSSTAVEIVWLVGLFQEVGVSISQPLSLFSDSTSALQIDVNHERTKHIDIDCHLMIQDELLVTIYLPSIEQPTVILTKALGTTSHSHFMAKLRMKNIFKAPILSGV